MSDVVELFPSDDPYSADLVQDQPALVVSVPGKGRMYRHPETGDLYPSITSIIGILDKPALVGWSARETALAAWENRDVLGRIADADAAVDLLKNARYRRTTRTANLGRWVHGLAEALSRDEALPVIPPEVAPYMDSFLRFVAEFEPTFTVVEGTVFSTKHRYAGTFDFLAQIGDLLVLGDHKSGKDIYAEVTLQLAAAKYADLLWNPATGDLAPMPRADRCIAVHLRPSGKPLVRAIRADRSDLVAFVGARQAWDWKKAGELGAVGPALNRARLLKAQEVET